MTGPTKTRTKQQIRRILRQKKQDNNNSNNRNSCKQTAIHVWRILFCFFCCYFSPKINLINYRFSIRWKFAFVFINVHMCMCASVFECLWHRVFLFHSFPVDIRYDITYPSILVFKIVRLLSYDRFGVLLPFTLLLLLLMMNFIFYFFFVF